MVHSESQVIENLTNIPLGKSKKAKRVQSIDVLVIRVINCREPSDDCPEPKYTLKMSKPCAHCIYHMSHMSHTGYRIRKVYYTTNDGSIAMEKLSDMICQPQYLSGFYNEASIPKYISNTFALVE